MCLYIYIYIYVYIYIYIPFFEIHMLFSKLHKLFSYLLNLKLYKIYYGFFIKYIHIQFFRFYDMSDNNSFKLKEEFMCFFALGINLIEFGHLPTITKTIQVRRTRHAGHCWRSRDELISDVLLWTPTHGRAKAVRPARTYIQQLCEDTGCCPEDLPEAMDDREKWRGRVRDIRATSTT